MRKLILLFLAFWTVGLGAQDLDMFQANVSWEYRGMKYDPNTLGNGWLIQPEFKYYFLAFAGQESCFAPCKDFLDYQGNFLVGAYITPTWSKEWKRSNTSSLPKIVEGDPDNAAVKDLACGLSFGLVYPHWFWTLESGFNFNNSLNKNGVRDSLATYPYYRGFQSQLTTVFLNDDYKFFNKFEVSLNNQYSLYDYRAIKKGNNYLLDTTGFRSQKFWQISSEISVASALINETAIDFNLIGSWLWYNGIDKFGLMPGADRLWQFGLGMDVRRLNKLNSAVKTSILFDHNGLQVTLGVQLIPFYDLLK